MLNPARRNALRGAHGQNPPTKGPTIVGVSNGNVSLVDDVVEEAHTSERVTIYDWTFSLRFPVFFRPPFPFAFLGCGCGGENGTDSVRSLLLVLFSTTSDGFGFPVVCPSSIEINT